jgi:hypothetical protein
MSWLQVYQLLNVPVPPNSSIGIGFQTTDSGQFL